MVAMTLLMSLAVVPFGVMAALYLREYAKSGPIISMVRIAINNLAGVPSIVFGVFGLGFFCYLVGAFIDGGPRHIRVEPLPALSWWIGFAAAVVVSLLAFFTYLGSKQTAARQSVVGGLLGQASLLLWVVCLGFAIFLLVKSPFFDGFFRAKLPSPTFGTGGILWSALTLSLLTLPVVIVATEEALAAVPNSLREGSYACGASKWQTIRHIVLPRAMPGIMTGMILAMARGAGEVAPIMLTGAVKLALDLPIDGVFPFIHMERSFMHLGFHIYDVGFQSPNSEAARPMVFTTTLLLIVIVALLNLTAVWLRRRLRQRFVVSPF
jgi:ABC-type phosphate transport system permease subunit